MKNFLLLILAMGFMCTNVFALKLPALFMDNMVLQQNTSSEVWGWADAGEKIMIESAWGEQTSATADQNGHWICDLKTPSAGGPYTITIKGSKDVIELKNILIGEVWFCSGQSNMEMPVEGWLPYSPIQNSQQEIEQADHPDIRLFTVVHNASLSLENDVIGDWEVCSPRTVRSFSATAYFFGRKLQKELNVPIGLIHSSWGGTPAQAWMDKEHLEKYPDFKQVIDKIDASKEKEAEQKAWLNNLPRVPVKKGAQGNDWAQVDLKDNEVSKVNFDDSQWKTMDLPRLWETSEVGEFDGVVWFRKKINLPDSFSGKDLVLKLGPIDDMDITYFNGTEVGRHMKEGFWEAKRIYKIPADLIQKDNNTIVVRVVDFQGGGGIYGSAQNMKIYPADSSVNPVSLAGDWKFLPVAEYRHASFYLFDIKTQQYYDRPKVPVESSPNNPTTLFNGMVHPVVPYTIKGVIWYQGEANTGNPSLYEQLFPDLIKNWRDIWGLGSFPFYFVQIAPWDYGKDTHSQELRDAQRKALKVPNTGMAVTVDIGEPDNIHPPDKQDVGKRLALWALAKTYNKDMVYSGPLYESAEFKNNQVIISFKYIGKGLTSKDGENLKHFLIAGEDKNFKKADAVIKDDKVIVSSPEVKNPKAVRYLWDNTSSASLFNADGLPASSFRTDNW